MDSVKLMAGMFADCTSLMKIILPNFNTDKIINMSYMFGNCSDDLKIRIKNKYNNIKDKAFEVEYTPNMN